MYHDEHLIDEQEHRAGNQVLASAWRSTQFTTEEQHIGWRRTVHDFTRYAVSMP